MAKFAMECPKCGTMNTASTFIFSKKVIKCCTCQEEINVKDNRMVTKKCPSCGKAIVMDQAKLAKLRKAGKEAKSWFCPICGKPINSFAETREYEYATISCPQCNCTIEAEKDNHAEICPICDATIDVPRLLEQMKQKEDGSISVIKYEGADNNVIVWKHPIEDFNTGSLLIVHDSQEAVFFMNGEALDSFGPGRYPLETENIPDLAKYYDLPTGHQHPFHAEVYFVNLTSLMGLKWGTDSKVNFVDPTTHIPLEIGASGQLNLTVDNGRKLLGKLVGTEHILTREQILGMGKGDEKKDVIKDAFRAMIQSTIKTHLAKTIIEQNIDILNIHSQLDVLNEALRTKVSAEFEHYGLKVPELYIMNVALPGDSEAFKRLKKAREESGLMGMESDLILEKKRRELEIQKMEEEGKRMSIDTARYEGMSEAQVMQAKGYSQKDLIDADVMKAQAAAMGQMGSHMGAGGGIAGEMMSVGVGTAMAKNMHDQVSQMMNFSGGPSTTVANGGDKCPQCGAAVSGNFCSNCGHKMNGEWKCKCGATVSGNFCSNCGAKKEDK